MRIVRGTLSRLEGLGHAPPENFENYVLTDTFLDTIR